jgi:hypothetical protein
MEFEGEKGNRKKLLCICRYVTAERSLGERCVVGVGVGALWLFTHGLHNLRAKPGSNGKAVGLLEQR